MHARQLLVLFLRLAGVSCLSAAVAVFVPRGWMAAAHEWLGFGTLPEGPMFEYLARLTSALYAQFGGLLLLLSTRVRRYERIIRYVAWTTVLMSVVLLGMGILGGMPLYWTGVDLAAAGLFGAVVLVLQYRLRGVEAKEEAGRTRPG